MPWQTHRDVRLEVPAARALDEACDQYLRADEAWQGLEWLLARKPDRGASRSKNGRLYRLYVQDSDELAGTPRITALFESTADLVVIHRLKFDDADAEE